MRHETFAARLGSRVTALFEDAALSFRLPVGATFADLADWFAHVAARTDSKAVAITVRMNLPQPR